MKKQTKIGLIALVVIAVCLVGYLAYYVARQSVAGSVYDDLQASVATQVPTQKPEEPDVTDAPDPTATLAPTEVPVETMDFTELHAINPDIYAWLEIKDTNIAYPVAQHESDNSYYLDYTIEGVHGLPGSIYTENYDAKDFSDYLTVIYGHNMANGSMFGELDLFRDATYLSEHRDVTIYTETQVLEYTIFAAVLYDNRYIPYVYDDTDVDDREDFLESLRSNTNWNTHILDDVEVTTDSNLLIMSTCVGGMPNNRYLIVAVLNED